MHYIVTGLTIIGLGIFLLVNKNTRSMIFLHKGKGFFFAFIAYTLLIALYNKNFIGIACSLACFLIVIISYYVRTTVTEQTFERCLDICCIAAIPLTVAAIVDKILCNAVPNHRIQLWFFNPNYFCAIMAAIVVICAFKVTSHKNGVMLYYICAAFAAVSMYIGQSMFAFVEMFVGLCVLLILKRKHLMLAIFLMAVCFCLIMIYCIPDLMPRIFESNITTDRRIRIWNDAMAFIQENPLFGRGFLSYYQYAGEHPEIYQTTHAHNFALEPLISFGIVGSVLLLLFLWSYYSKVTECKELLRVNCATTLILAISAGVLAHMTTDMTALWIQTGFLYALILGGIGIDEKALNRRIIACTQKSDSIPEASPNTERTDI